MIRFRDVRFSYDDSFAMCVDEFSVEAGGQVAIYGPSGSGKTTLLNLVAGILVPDSGNVQVGPHAVSSLSDARRRYFRANHVGHVFQRFELIEYLSVLDNILHTYRISELVLTDDVRARAESLAERLDISKHLKKYPGALSQGELQRVAICRALLAKPSVILADEPTANLDAKNKTLILDLLLDESREQGAALLMVTHDHSLLDRFETTVDFSLLTGAGNG